ncbi:hypothetical protein F383_19284 [Gossypium arboreum]|uniref:Uncharacterized protein n=1 Tax=Gossypium arboreum TaxID=29729 RepID=A0A0B0NMA7_GOSAR|nr:hypothetical protein F383_19284 [Gossypium arboreum]
MSRTCIGYEMCQCKTISGTWHRHGDVRARVRPCLGHSVGLDFNSHVRPCLGHGIGITPYV